MSSPTCPVHGTKLTYPIVPRVSMYGCADCFRDTPFSSWQFTDAPAPLAFDAALAALDVEPTHHTDRMVTTYDILGLDAVRAAHRAEVERAVREAVEQEREAIAAWHDAEAARITRECAESRRIVRENPAAFVGISTSLEYEEAQAETHRECAAVIRARGVAKPRTDGEASEQGAKS